MNDTPKGNPSALIYAYIVSSINAEGLPPTNREIGKAMGSQSTGHVDEHLRSLEQQGFITRLPGKARSIRLTGPNSGIPIIGAIAAGTPLDLFPEAPDLRELLPMDRSLLAANVFALVVHGQSMIEDFICDGDYIIVNPQQTCQNGDIVVATHMQSGANGSATLKRFFQEEDQVRLQPSNSEMKPLIIPKNEWCREWTIQGKVMAIFLQGSRTKLP